MKKIEIILTNYDKGATEPNSILTMTLPFTLSGEELVEQVTSIVKTAMNYGRIDHIHNLTTTVEIKEVE